MSKNILQVVKDLTKTQKDISNMLPNIAKYDSAIDTLWNFIPLGMAVDSNEVIKPIGWYLNDQNISNDYINMVPSGALLLVGGNGSGKNVAQDLIIQHVNEFASRMQLIGVDLNRNEFIGPIRNKFSGGVLNDINSIAESLDKLQVLMMTRFKLMLKAQVNNIYKVDATKIKVDYYNIKGIGKVQFDEILSIKINDQSLSLSARDFYNLFIDSEEETMIVNDIKITQNDITQFFSNYKSSTIICMIDDINIINNYDDYNTVKFIYEKIGSIARLGRAAGIHLVIGCKRCSRSTISADLQNNIGTRVVFGIFDDVTSNIVFEQDISEYCRPENKGRAFITDCGSNIYESQTLFTDLKELFYL